MSTLPTNCTNPVVTSLTVSRLFNLGNYQHERIEVTVKACGYETSDGVQVECHIHDPVNVLENIRTTLAACGPIEKEWAVEQGERIKRGEVVIWDGQGDHPGREYVGSEIAKESLQELERYNTIEAARKQRLQLLNNLGTVTLS